VEEGSAEKDDLENAVELISKKSASGWFT